MDNCVAYALEHNLQLKDFKYNTASGKETYRQSIRNLLPSVSASSRYSVTFGRSINPNDNTITNTDFFRNEYSLQSSIDLFQGFQKINTIKASKLIYKATQEETLQQKYLLAFRVMSAFYDVKFSEGLITISKEQAEISQANYDLTKKQIELGLMAGADLYEAESTLLTDKLGVTQSENILAAAQLNLIQEMNFEGARNIPLKPDLGENPQQEYPLEANSDSIYHTAKGFIPIIKAQELRARAAKKEVAIARGDLYPSLSFFAGLGTEYSETIVDSLDVTIPFRDQFNDNAFRFIGVSLNVPISNGWSSRSNVKQRKIALLRARNNLEIQEQELYQLIQQLVQEHEALKAEYMQSTQRVDSQNLAFMIARKRYEKGLINALELFTAKNLFASAQNENLQVRLRLKVNESTLDFYSGLPVFNIN